MALTLEEQRRLSEIEQTVARREGIGISPAAPVAPEVTGLEQPALSPEEASRLQYLESTLAGRGVTEAEPRARREGAGAEFYEFTKRLEESPVTQTALGLGETIQDIMRGAVESGYDIPRRIGAAVTGEEFVPTAGAEGLPYELGRMGTEMGAFLVAPQATVPARIGQAAAVSAALDPQDAAEAAAMGAAFGAVGEAIPYAGRFAESTIDKFTRTKYTDDLVDEIAKSYNVNKERAWGIINPTFERQKNKEFTSGLVSKIDDFVKKDKEYMTTGIRKSLSTFKKNPTMENMQKLQSQVGRDIRSLDPTDAANQTAIAVRSEWKDAMQGSLKQGLETFEPGSAKLYEEFLESYARDVGPYLSTKKLGDIAKGRAGDVSPQKLKSALIGATRGEGATVPAEHYLGQLVDPLTQKMGRTAGYQMAGGAAPGLALGGMLGGPSGAALGGFLGGATPGALSKLAGTTGASAQREMTRLLEQLYPGFEEITRPAILGLATEIGREE